MLLRRPQDMSPPPPASVAAAKEDVLQLCQKLLTMGPGDGSPADVVRSHFAGRADLGDEQVAALLQAELR